MPTVTESVCYSESEYDNAKQAASAVLEQEHTTAIEDAPTVCGASSAPSETASLCGSPRLPYWCRGQTPFWSDIADDLHRRHCEPFSQAASASLGQELTKLIEDAPTCASTAPSEIASVSDSPRLQMRKEAPRWSDIQDDDSSLMDHDDIDLDLDDEPAAPTQDRIRKQRRNRSRKGASEDSAMMPNFQQTNSNFQPIVSAMMHGAHQRAATQEHAKVTLADLGFLTATPDNVSSAQMQPIVEEVQWGQEQYQPSWFSTSAVGAQHLPASQCHPHAVSGSSWSSATWGHAGEFSSAAFYPAAWGHASSSQPRQSCADTDKARADLFAALPARDKSVLLLRVGARRYRKMVTGQVDFQDSCSDYPVMRHHVSGPPLTGYADYGFYNGHYFGAPLHEQLTADYAPPSSWIGASSIAHVPSLSEVQMQVQAAAPEVYSD